MSTAHRSCFFIITDVKYDYFLTFFNSYIIIKENSAVTNTKKDGEISEIYISF